MHDDEQATVERPGVSVIICCYNSAERIKPTLHHLALQRVSADVPVEIVLVDNNSTDDTAAIAAACWQAEQSPFPFRVVTEKKQGLSNARERGLAETQYETVVFCDDDNWLNEGFVEAAARLTKAHPEAAVMGGPIIPAFEKEPEPWLQPYYGFLALGSMETEGDITATRAFVPGAGMVINRRFYRVLKKNNFTFFCSDRKGQRLSSGGDTEFCYALVLAGGRVCYFNALALQHYVPVGRTTWDYVSRLVPQIAAATCILNLYKEAIQGKRPDKEELRKLRREKFRYVYNPLQYFHARKNMNVGNKTGLKYNTARAVLKQLNDLLFTPGVFSSLQEQLQRIAASVTNTKAR